MKWDFIENIERGLDGVLYGIFLAFHLMALFVGLVCRPLLVALLVVTTPLWLPVYLLGRVMQRVEK